MNETHYQISNGITGHRIELPSDSDAAALAQMLTEHGLALYELRPVEVTFASAPKDKRRQSALIDERQTPAHEVSSRPAKRKPKSPQQPCPAPDCRRLGAIARGGYCRDHEYLHQPKRRGPRGSSSPNFGRVGGESRPGGNDGAVPDFGRVGGEQR